MAKIVLISDRNIYMKRICNFLAEHNHEVWLVCRLRKKRAQDGFIDNIHFFEFSSEKLFVKWREFKKLIRNVNPDFVHLHYLSRDIILPALIFRRNFRFIVTIWGSDLNVASKNPVNRLLQNVGLIRADAIHLISAFFFRSVRSKYHFINKRKINVFSWGIDLRNIREVTPEDMTRLKQKYALDNRRIILSFRHHHPFYNHHTLIRTVAYIAERFNDVIFVFVCGESDPAYLEQSQKLVAASGKTEHVVFIKEWLDEKDLAALIRMSVISVNIPFADGLPASLLEIMATDSIPVAGDLPSYREFYKENINGLSLHSLTNSVELQGILEFALKDTDRLKGRFARRNREYIETYHNWEVQSEKLLELYINL